MPDFALLEELARLASAGVHGPAEMPFSVPWTKGSPEEAARSVFQYVLRTFGGRQPAQGVSG
ncbi:hypothetical protein [Streptomyces sp. 549]|uniref:hypothetical protein n=1 Tax=Streptomyces sp. 549 TaxID=3049076 RepID=UPI0032E36256